MISTIEGYKKAIKAWELMTNSDVDFKYGVIECSFTYGVNKKIRKSLEIDDSGILCMTLIDAYRKDFLEKSTFTALEIMEDSEEIRDLIHHSKCIDLAMAECGFTEIWKNRVSDLNKQLLQYGPNDFDPIKPRLISEIGYDAVIEKHSMQHLVLRSGTVTKEITKYNKIIYQFDSVNELVSVTSHIPDGFTLGAIIPSDSTYCYFILIVKQGNHISIFSDGEIDTHPLQRERKRNARSQVDRISNSSFPYELFDFDVQDNSRYMDIKSKGVDLPALSEKVRALGDIGSLNIHNILFLHLIFERINLELGMLDCGEKGYSSGLLMIGNEINCTNFPAVLNQDKMSIPKLGVSEISRKPFLKSQESNEEFSRSTNYYGWLENLLKDKISAYQVESFLPSLSKPKVLSLESSDQDEQDRWMSGWNASLVDSIKFRELPSESIMSREAMVADAYWIARHNYAQVLQQAAIRDFDENKQSMLEWITQETLKNMTVSNTGSIIKALCDPDQAWYVFDKSDEKYLNTKGANQTFSRLCGNEGQELNAYWNYNKDIIASSLDNVNRSSRVLNNSYLSPYNNYYGRFSCFYKSDDDHMARVFIHFSLSNGYEISKLTGIDYEYLPPRIKNIGMVGYTGNSILNRLDPVECITTPYEKYKPTIIVPLSMKSLNELRLKNGYEKITITALKKAIK